MEPYWIVILTIVVLAVVKLGITFVLGGFSFARLGLAIQAYLKVLGDAEAGKKVEALLKPAATQAPKPAKLSGEPLRLLTLLQRDGRLLDFLLEDISMATDDQIGAGVREIHKKAQSIIKEHLTLEPILAGEEEATVEVPPGFDPSAIRVTGNVTGEPPFKGVLKHHGWRVKTYKLPSPPSGVDELVVAPAEVELP